MIVTEAEFKGPRLPARPLLEGNTSPLLCPSSLLATPREDTHSKGSSKRCVVRVIEDFDKVLLNEVSSLLARLTSELKKAFVDIDIDIHPPAITRDDMDVVRLGATGIASSPALAKACEIEAIPECLCSKLPVGTKSFNDAEHDPSNRPSSGPTNAVTQNSRSNHKNRPLNDRHINVLLRGDTRETDAHAPVHAKIDSENGSEDLRLKRKSKALEQCTSRRSKYLVGCAVAAGINDNHETCMKRWCSLVQRVIEINGIADKFEDDDDDTMVFEFHPDWANKDQGKMNTTLLASFNSISETQQRASRVSLTAGARFDDVVMENSWLQWLAIHPHSLQRFVWGLLGALLIFYDIITLPMILTFQVEQPRSLEILEFVAFLYWVIDLLMNFFLGFMRDGLLEMRLKQIMLNYVRTWFVADLLIVLMDVAFFFLGSLESASAALRVSKSLRIMRMLRLIRLVRLVRLRKLIAVVNTFWHDIRSDSNKLVLVVTRNMFSILIFNHYIACMWYGMADISAREDSWVHKYELAKHGVVYSYAMSMHWALCQFTPATNNIHPENVTERIFACVLVIFALVAFSSFVSGTTNAVSQLRAINQEKLNECTKIRAFITDRKLSYRLGNQILTFFHANYNRAHRPHEQDIKFLNEVPQSMMMRLHEEVYHPILMTNWMFFAFINVNLEFWRKLCHHAVTEKTYASQQDVFIASTLCDRIYYLEHGTLRYITDCEESDVDIGTWLSEMSLWVKWIHSGQITADGTCELMELDCNVFRHLAVHMGGAILSCLTKFAVFVIGYAERLCEGDENAISDLPLPRNVLKDLGMRILKLHHRQLVPL